MRALPRLRLRRRRQRLESAHPLGACARIAGAPLPEPATRAAYAAPSQLQVLERYFNRLLIRVHPSVCRLLDQQQRRWMGKGALLRLSAWAKSKRRAAPTRQPFRKRFCPLWALRTCLRFLDRQEHSKPREAAERRLERALDAQEATGEPVADEAPRLEAAAERVGRKREPLHGRDAQRGKKAMESRAVAGDEQGRDGLIGFIRIAAWIRAAVAEHVGGDAHGAGLRGARRQ